MADAHAFLRDLTLVLAVAAVTTVLFQRLKQPVVLGYLLAGAIISPNTPTPLVANLQTVHTLSEIGVILLMFSLGLEFSLRKLIKVGPRAAFVALVQSSFMVWFGFTVGRLFGWTVMESLFAGAAIAISSTTIIVKAFEEQGVKGPIASLVFAVLIVEDLIAILLLAILTPVATGASLSAGDLAFTVIRLVLFLLAILIVGYLTIPRGVRFVLGLNRPETTLVACVGTCFALSYVAQAAGYSVALGAFLAGSLIAESGEEKQIEHLIQPVRDVFAAIFFVAVGMLLDPHLIAEHWVSILVLSAVVIGGKLIGVALASFFAGYGTRTSIQAGMSLAQIGEFSFIIASVGLSLGAVGSFLYPVAVAVSAATTLTTPWLIRSAPALARVVDHRLPQSLQTFTALYASWIERLGAPSEGTKFAKETRRLVVLLCLDAVGVALVIFGTSLAADWASAALEAAFGLGQRASHVVVTAAGAAASTPFAIGIFRCARRLALIFAEQTFAGSSASQKLSAASRRTMIAGIYLAIVLLVGLPVLALTQPVISSFQGGVVLVAAVGVALFAVFKSAVALDAEVRAGTQVIVDALERAIPAAADHGPHASDSAPLLGLGSTSAFRLEAGHSAVGKSLAELDLRSRTGAAVLALERGDGPAIVPTPYDPLRADDVLVLAGTRESVDAGVRLLRGD